MKIFMVQILCTLLLVKNNGYIKKSNGNKYLVFASTNGKKEVLIKYAKLWDKMKYLFKTKNCGKESEYGKNFMKIRFELAIISFRVEF